MRVVTVENANRVEQAGTRQSLSSETKRIEFKFNIFSAKCGVPEIARSRSFVSIFFRAYFISMYIYEYILCPKSRLNEIICRNSKQ